jgi:ribokinase
MPRPTEKAPKVVIVGSSNTDLVIQSPRFPKPGESVIGGVFAQFQGGKGANQAVAAARAGAQVTFIGRVGQDDFGRIALERLQAENINTDHVENDEQLASGVALIIVDASGENEIVVAAGANMALSPEQINHAVDIIAAADVVVTQLEIPLESVLHLAELTKKLGKTLILNPAPASPVPETLLPLIDVITPNMGELEVISGIVIESLNDVERAAQDFLRKGVTMVVVTQGKQGCLTFTLDNQWITPALPIEPVDTVGAGDCFTGTLAVALARGLTPVDAIRYASIAAGISVTRLGAQPSMPYRHEVDTIYYGA